MAAVVLVRYGVIPEVSRFATGGLDLLSRGESVLVETHRGLQLGTVLQVQASPSPRSPHLEMPSPDITEELSSLVRRATDDDRQTDRQLQEQAHAEFDAWRERIQEWQLELELIDLEWTADRKKLILYVLNERGPDCTKLALQAAAAGLGIIEVQPVTADGLVTIPTASHGGGCGSCGSH